MAGNNARRRERFFKEHPWCCFCGGSAQAVEIDHFPSRVLFLNRQWPEGYAFPACARCNRVTARDELLVAWLARARNREEHTEHMEEFERLFADVETNFPGVLQSMSRMTHRERRQKRELLGITLQPGQSHLDLPFLSVRDPRIQGAVLNFGRKLGLALFYKNAGRAVPKEGGVAVRWYSNIQIETDVIPRELGSVVPNFPPLNRARQDLSDQFFYRIGIADGQEMATFLAIFRRSFGILGFMARDISRFAVQERQSDESRQVFSPYDWDEAPSSTNTESK